MTIKCPPDERAVLSRGDEFYEFKWNPSEYGVAVTRGLLEQGVKWDRSGSQVLRRLPARRRWAALKAQGYRTMKILVTE